MEGDKLNNGKNQRASASHVQGNSEFDLTNRQNDSDSTRILQNGSSARGDPMSFTYTPPVASSPYMGWTYQPHYTHSIPDTHGSLIGGLNQLHNLPNPMVHPNTANMSSNIPCLNRQDIHFPGGNVCGIPTASYNHYKAGVVDAEINDSPPFNSFQNPEGNRNLTLVRGNAGRVYEMTRQGREAYGSNIHGPQIKNFFGSGGGKTMLNRPQNNIKVNIDNYDQVNAAQFGCPKKIDGSFLSLGIGAKMDARYRSDFSSREVAGKLDGVVSPQLDTSYAQQVTECSLNPGHSLIGGFSSFQNNVDGFASLGHKAEGSNNNVGVINDSNTGLNSSPFHIAQKPQADAQHGFPKSSSRKLSFIGNQGTRYANLNPHKGFVGEPAISTGPFSSTSAGLLDFGQTGAAGVTLESVKSNRTTIRPNSNLLQKQFVGTVQNLSLESSTVSSCIGFGRSSSGQGNSGQQFSVHDVIATCAGGASQLPKTVGSRAIEDSAAQAAGRGLFPRRLGIQVNEHSAAQAAGDDDLFPKTTGVQVTDSRVAYAAERGFYPKERGIQRESYHQEGVPIPFFKDLIESTSTALYGHSQSSNVGQQILKRVAVQPPPAAPRVQRRKTFQPPVVLSMPSQPETAPATAISIPAVLAHTKLHDTSSLPKPIGQKCMLCKRDLSFTPEGPVHQPRAPPVVAVLPCGHTFHDHCLQLITPEGQDKNPPCIPCAIGET